MTRVVLREDVDGVGHRGDIVDVSGGFARNRLLPEGRAIVATKGIEAQASAMRRARDLREAHDREAAESQARVLEGAMFTIDVRAGRAGRLFGSVSAADVARVVQDQKGVELGRHQVVLDEPIKAVGSYEIVVNLYRGVSSKITLEVRAPS